jgi:SAM-dependent methyltransferase
MIIGKTGWYGYWKSVVSRRFKEHRLRQIFRLIKLDTTKKLRILEIGCGDGKDVIQFLSDGGHYDLYGVDIKDSRICQDNFTFVLCDAEKMPFDDRYFDLVISIGVLEHIEPMEKLSRIIQEIDRVSKNYVAVIPSLNTPIEPHTLGLFWPLRLEKGMVHKHTKTVLKLNFFTDHTWSKFQGFQQAEIRKKWYIPPFIMNTFIYKCGSEETGPITDPGPIADAGPQTSFS